MGTEPSPGVDYLHYARKDRFFTDPVPWPWTGQPGGVAFQLIGEKVAVDIPTTSEWGLIVMTLLLIASGVLMLRRLRPSRYRAR